MFAYAPANNNDGCDSRARGDDLSSMKESVKQKNLLSIQHDAGLLLLFSLNGNGI